LGQQRRTEAFWTKLRKAHPRTRIDWSARLGLAVGAQRTPDDWLMWAEAAQAVKCWVARLRQGGPAKKPIHWFSKENLVAMMTPCPSARETSA
jgi:hypothetical protein